jgi:hypothetical protein
MSNPTELQRNRIFATGVNRRQPASTGVNRRQPASTGVNRRQPASTGVNRLPKPSQAAKITFFCNKDKDDADGVFIPPFICVHLFPICG